ncbi:cdc42 effector protein 2 [Rhea pennata]|uniref:cdc42 effector protein 2 n=1 Tax=Rhea pennata TaxID=8795 RepID=UPI002E273AA9
MAAKVPIYLKRGGRKGKKEKLRDILSSDMISPPLGDFRHTIHVGSGGERDAFGDISFLRGKFHLLPRSAGRPDSEPEDPAAAEPDRAPSGEPSPASPLLKNAVSLPIIGGPPKPPRLHLDDGAAGSRSARRLGGPATGSPEEPFLPHAGSLLSLHVDLGPSILDDVLEVMEKHRDERRGGPVRDPARREVLT